MNALTSLRQFADCRVAEHITLTNDDMKAVNTQSNSNCMAPVAGNASRMENGHFTTVLGKHSWNIIRLKA